MIVLAYLWLLALVPLVIERTDREVQWHARNGLVLMAAELVFWLVLIAVTSLAALASWGLGLVLSLFVMAAWIGVLLMHAAAIIKGIAGGRLIVPGVSAFADRV